MSPFESKKHHPYTTENISPVACLVCGKEIKCYDNPCDNPGNDMWKNGIVNEIAAGYGSSLDGEVYLIAVCDECIIRKRNEGKVIFLYDYMNPYSEEMRQKYNVKLHRKMKLKKILNDTS